MTDSVGGVATALVGSITSKLQFTSEPAQGSSNTGTSGVEVRAVGAENFEVLNGADGNPLSFNAAQTSTFVVDGEYAEVRVSSSQSGDQFRVIVKGLT